ncbi:MAG: hypothetical protein CSA82_01560 [Actinobacteria bacterium]|nr:MAG: hypothetical protein CSA82_01560 [Actinomycetota bacterium]
MADIEVDYDALNYLSGSLHGLKDTVPKAMTYSSSHAELKVSGGDMALYLAIADTAKKVEDALSKWLVDTATACRAGAEAVEDCVIFYQQHEERVVAEFHGVYTESDAAGAHAGASSVAAAKLTPPVNDVVFDDVFDAMGLMGNVISPSFWLGTFTDWVLDAILGAGEHDPFKAIGDLIAGDWEKISLASDALSKLGDYYTCLEEELRERVLKIDADWNGGASDAAQHSLKKTADSFGEVAEKLSGLSKDYNTVAIGVFQTADVLTGLLRSLADWGIAAAIAAAAGTATAETVVGAIAGWGVAGWSVWKMLNIVEEIFSALDLTWQIASVFSGQCALWLGDYHSGGRTATIHIPAFVEE